ncbi:cytokinin dehydrogenase 3-like [Dendrobium catenatum]|uniref:cytokinin dehydrogenase n=1 Tax=Dendrobium catenatum TaxID=906689 RepID=A0A2I0WMM4_9ASPA|nr:cytokinin dehydrogenase 3-like [Dendrobium catenatum]PKU76914.1 Cytokinin dehydrogenase 3 [Dendrobium catenatum]
MHSNLLFLSTLFYLILSSFSTSNLIPYQSDISILDFGRIIEENPIAILNPKSPQEISLLIQSIFSKNTKNIQVAPRGAAHSTYGQSQVLGGIIINMTLLPTFIKVEKEKEFVDVGGGDLWVDVLHETLKHGLTPRSWTDYLYLTIGGTLSVGGISGQSFKHGPQISNVLELDVITGKGEFVTCSEEKDSDLFYGVLGGFGQFGIITRARIILQSAPKLVKWVVISYKSFEQFRKDQELLINGGEVDYLEGFINLQRRNSSEDKLNDLVSYLIEFAVYYDDEDVAYKKLNHILPRLNYKESRPEITDTSYFDFLNRVRKSELELSKEGLWNVPHPWLNVFLPRSQIKRFKDLLLETIADTYTSGPIIIYPIFRNKWNPKMSAVLPQVDTEEDIIYVVSVLQSAPPTCTRGTPCLDTMLLQNQKIINIATTEPIVHNLLLPAECVMNEDREEMGAKQYMPYLQNEMQWKAHFGWKWERFQDLKRRFDPLHILAPGQRIFQKK